MFGPIKEYSATLASHRENLCIALKAHWKRGYAPTRLRMKLFT